MDITLLLAPVSIKNLKAVPLIDASANLSSPESIFNKIEFDFGLEQFV